MGAQSWTCSSCGRPGAAGARFCGHCGAPAAPVAPAATWSCRQCGTANPQVNAFCGGCGARAQAARSEELRLVTALFADISGFTTLADSLDVESLHEVITPLVRGLTLIAERYEGFVEKFAGDALLVVYGAPVTHEDDAQRALLAALDMHAELPRLLAGIGPHAAHLTIHIGVNTGRVIARQAGSEQQSDYAVLGDSVILAQRLESVCPPGQTYVGPTTYALCKEEFDLEPVGELTLKGKLQPVEGFRLVGRRSTGEATASRLVGRDRELAAAEEGITRRAVTTLVGEPGVGKSRLLHELRRRGREDRVRWLSARCLSYGAALPYWPVADLVRQELGLAADATPEAGEELLASLVPPEAVAGLRRLLGRVGEGEPGAARREVHDAVAAWLQQLATRARVVLSLEDVHWADRPTVELLSELVRRDDVDLALLLTTRREGTGAAADVAGERAHQVVELGALDRSAVAAVAAELLGGPVAEDLVDLVLSQSSGNALHVRELTRSLAETGALVLTVQGWDLRPGYDRSEVSASVERVLATRLDALPPQAARALQLASVIGRTVRLSLLRAVDPQGDVDLALPVLVQSGMLERTVDSAEEAVTFSHALLQEVVYERLLRKRRRDLHRRVADVARATYGDGDDTIGLLARHLYLAGAREEAVEPLLRAGRRAARLFANDTAAEHLRRAVEVLERLDDPRLVDALLELADVQQLRGAYDDALGLYARVRELRPEGADGWRGGGAVLGKLGRYDEAVALLDEAPARGCALLVERAHNAFLSGSPARALHDLRQALAAAADDAERADALLQLVTVECQIDHPEFALAHGTRAMALLESSGDARRRARAHRLLGDACCRLQRFAEAAAHLRQAVGLAEQLGDVEEAAGALVNLALVHSGLGEAAEAEAVTHAAAQRFERIGHGSGRAICYGNLADDALARGDLEAAREWAQRSLTVSVSIGHRRQAAVAQLTLAEVALAAGCPEQALAILPAAQAVFEELAAGDMVAYCERVRSDARPTA